MHSLYEQANALTDEVIAAAVTVQKHFGIGVLESIYVRCLERELQLSGHTTSREQSVAIAYRGMVFDEKLRYDLLVDDCLLIEAKACEKEDMDLWRMQLLSYMKLMDKPLGVVMNFGNRDFPRRGFKRVFLKGADGSQAKNSDDSVAVAGIPAGVGEPNRSKILRVAKRPAFTDCTERNLVNG